MPWFTLNRNYALSTTKGHSVNFKKGERTWVPAGIVPEAIAIGAIPEVPTDILPDEAKQEPAMSTADREAKIFAVFEKLLLRNQRGDFQASGMPHPKKVEDLCGFPTNEKERQVLWEKYNQKKSDEALQ